MQSLERLGPFFPGGRIGFLLVHGLAGTPAEMKILGKRLNRYGFTVLCPQLAGHCASEEELITTCWSDWSRSVEDAFDALSQHMDAVFVGGLSAGAVLSLRHAQRYPGRARGLALYSTTLRYDGWTIPKLSFLLPLILLHAAESCAGGRICIMLGVPAHVVIAHVQAPFSNRSNRVGASFSASADSR